MSYATRWAHPPDKAEGQQNLPAQAQALTPSPNWQRPLRLLGKDEVCRDDRIFVKSKCQKVDESGFPDEGKNFPDRPI